ncbi:transcriptional repressor [Leuconostoc mesenteroides]|uniref:Fur family transcriptional regulator n=1 Tax=Lactobacillaceae TaxID=33958 RepID=UPI00090A246A|nr:MULTISPECIES: Fur family transcriptional regulator [Leuconostoc]API73067.1 hypothetical protein A6B45_10110 [Leuconostoc suionicum]KAA8345772.1 transcriptional repressor [Leuconostoc mesenteroides]MBZ5983808.1 transcriptional repressor [Leuconostoc gasicomitatum]MBZ6013576.1 transcriptional repressor [Leuconostoc gelidum subsp. gelidum]MCS8585676.1 transcriptional repressor [Leuconostoc mesenteroides]
MSALNEIIEKLRSAGFKATPQRKSIIQYLIDSDTHPSAQQISDDLHANLTTVYNTLAILESENFVITIENEQSGEKSYDFFDIPHYHLVCVHCGKIEDKSDIDFAPLWQKVQNHSTFKPKQIHLEFTGVCAQCQLKGLQ